MSHGKPGHANIIPRFFLFQHLLFDFRGTLYLRSALYFLNKF